MVLRRIRDYFNRWVRACYDWMINMASNEHAMYFLVVVAFIESSFFPIPPDIMLIPMVLAAPQKALFSAARSHLPSFRPVGQVLLFRPSVSPYLESI